MQVRCPQCHNPVELVDDSPLGHVSCPSCDDEFSLLGEDTVSHQHDQHKMIGQFELIDQLGSGSFGVVWKARDTQLDRLVAVKIPRRGQLGPQESEQFLREARAAAQLKHPGIVTVLEVGRNEDYLYIVSDFVEGFTLADMLTDQPPSFRDSAELCKKIADALQHAHDAGVIHRDLKPSNIILDNRRQPHVMDFGLARREVGEVTMTIEGKVLGTPSYMSPEQATGQAHKADRRSDIYSLGVILFELLTGERPFRGNMRMLLQHVIHDEPPSPRRLNHRIPRDLETICLKCLEKQPGNRYQAANALAAELQRFLKGEPIKARPVGSASRLWRWYKRKPVLAGLISTVSACLLFISIAAPLVAIYQSELRSAAENHADEANRQLYRSLVRESQAIRLARQSGYRRYVWNLLTEAMDLDVPDKNLEELRTEAVACMGDFAAVEPTTWDDFEFDVRAIALNPDASQVAVGLADGSISIRSVYTRKEVVRLAVDPSKDPTAFWFRIRFGHDESTLLSAVAGKPTLIWNQDAEGQWTSKRVPVDAFVLDFAVPHSGTALVVGRISPTEIAVWDADDGKQVAGPFMAPGQVYRATLSQDAKLLAAACGGGKSSPIVRVWNTTNDGFHDPEPPRGHSIDALNFSADHLRLVIASRDGIAVYRTADFARIGSLTDQPAGVTFHQGNQLIAFPSRQLNLVKLWHAVTHNQVAALNTVETPRLVEFSSNGKTLAAAGDHFVNVWHLDTEETLTLRGHNGGVTDVAFSPDAGRGWLASTSKDGSIRIWDTSTGENLQGPAPLPRSGQCVSFSPNSRLLAAGDYETGTVRVVETDSWAQLQDLDNHLGKRVNAVTFSQDGRYLAAGGQAGWQLWRVTLPGQTESDYSFVSKQHRSTRRQVRHACFSPDAQILAFEEGNTWPTDVYFLDVPNSRLIHRPDIRPFSGLRSLDFFSDSKRLVFTNVKRIPEIVDLTGHGTAPILLEPPKKNRVVGSGMYHCPLSLSPDDNWIAALSISGRGVHIWDVTTRKPILSLPERQSVVWCLDWSPDSNQLAIGWADGSLEIWRISSIRSQLAELGLSW